MSHRFRARHNHWQETPYHYISDTSLRACLPPLESSYRDVKLPQPLWPQIGYKCNHGGSLSITNASYRHQRSKVSMKWAGPRYLRGYVPPNHATEATWAVAPQGIRQYQITAGRTSAGRVSAPTDLFVFRHAPRLRVSGLAPCLLKLCRAGRVSVHRPSGTVSPAVMPCQIPTGPVSSYLTVKPSVALPEGPQLAVTRLTPNSDAIQPKCRCFNRASTCAK